jgi:hypothetical protein
MMHFCNIITIKIPTSGPQYQGIINVIFPDKYRKNEVWDGQDVKHAWEV